MRIVGKEPEAVWVDLPDGGKLQFRIPRWEDRERAIGVAADATEGKQDYADVMRVLLISTLIGQKGFQVKGTGKPVAAKLPRDAETLIRGLSLADVRAIETATQQPMTEADSALGN